MIMRNALASREDSLYNSNSYRNLFTIQNVQRQMFFRSNWTLNIWWPFIELENEQFENSNWDTEIGWLQEINIELDANENQLKPY